MKRSILPLLLALSLATGLFSAPASAAASAPRLVLSSKEESTSHTVGLTGVPADCQSLQITLNLSSDSAAYTYVPDISLNRGGLYTTWKQDGAAVTLYLAAKSGVLTQSGSLTLGTLSTADTPFTVTGASGLKLLDDAAADSTFPAVEEGSASTGGGSTAVTTWAINVARPTGGSLTASTTRAARGTTITLTAAPAAGYVLEKVTVTDAAGRAVALTEVESGRYTFTMPASGVTASASFVFRGEPPVERPFGDVPAGAWYEEAVQYVYENGLMSGTGDGRFSPEVTTSRAMIVTILYRQAGSPAVTGSAAFTDVDAGTWYTDAVTWASANGIVSGYGEGKFGPSDPITREQMAAILCRYASYKGMDVTKRADLSAFADAGQVSDYALETMRWAVAQGLITGTSETTLSPAGSATRAQAALILMRFAALGG